MSEYFSDEPAYYCERKSAVRPSRKQFPSIDTVPKEKNLAEQLLFQLQMATLDKELFKIGEYLIGNLIHTAICREHLVSMPVICRYLKKRCLVCCKLSKL